MANQRVNQLGTMINNLVKGLHPRIDFRQESSEISRTIQFSPFCHSLTEKRIGTVCALYITGSRDPMNDINVDCVDFFRER